MSGNTDQSDYHTVTPYLIVPNVARLLEFLAEAFDAKEQRIRLGRPDGSIMHAEVTIGDSVVMMGEPNEKNGPMAASIFLRVTDADAAYRKALQAGATSISEPVDQPQAGERYGGVLDPCGNRWWPASRLTPVKS